LSTPTLTFTETLETSKERVRSLQPLRHENDDENVRGYAGSDDIASDGYNSEELMRTAPIAKKKKTDRNLTKKEPRYIEDKAPVSEVHVKFAPYIQTPQSHEVQYLDVLYTTGISPKLRADTSSYLFFSLTVGHSELITNTSGTKRNRKEISEADKRIERCRGLCLKMEKSIHQVSVTRIADAIRTKAAQSSEMNLQALKAKYLPVATSMYSSSVSRLSSVLRAHGTRELASAVISGRIDAPSFIRTLFQRMASIPIPPREERPRTEIIPKRISLLPPPLSSSSSSLTRTSSSHSASDTLNTVSSVDRKTIMSNIVEQNVRAAKLLALREAFARKRALKISLKEEKKAAAAAVKASRAAQRLQLKQARITADSINAHSFPTRNLPARSTRGKHSLSEAAIQDRLNEEAVRRRESELDKKDPSRAYKRAVAGMNMDRIAAWKPELSISKAELEDVFGTSNMIDDEESDDLPPGTAKDPTSLQREQPLDFELVDSEEEGDLDDLELLDEGADRVEEEELDEIDDAGLEKLLTLVEGSQHDAESHDKLKKIGLDIDWLALGSSSQDSLTLHSQDIVSTGALDAPDHIINESNDDLDNLLDIFGGKSEEVDQQQLDDLFQQDLLLGFQS
jgi:hypothetical protein